MKEKLYYKKVKLMFFLPSRLLLRYCLYFEMSPMIISLTVIVGWGILEVFCQFQVLECTEIDKNLCNVNIYAWR